MAAITGSVQIADMNVRVMVTMYLDQVYAHNASVGWSIDRHMYVAA